MNQPPVTSAAPPPRGSGLAIASLALGLLGFIGGIVVVGVIFSLLGLVFGIVQLARRGGGRGMAIAGIIFSVLGIGLSAAVVIKMAPIVRQAIRKARDAMQTMNANASPSSTTDASFAVWQGVVAPDIKVTTLDGKTIQLSELKGKRVVLDFWATWCPPCVKEIPHFVMLRGEVPADELVLIGISSEDTATLKSFVRKHGVNYPIATADDLPSPYKDVEGIPTTFFLDRNGVIQEVLVGYHEFEQLKEHATAKDFEGPSKASPASTQ